MFMPNPGILAAGASPLVGQQLFLTGGTFVVPAGVTSICGVAIGRGEDGEKNYIDGTDTQRIRAGGGGGLAYINNLTVTPLEQLVCEITDQWCLLRRDATVLLRARGVGSISPVGTGFGGGSRSAYVELPNSGGRRGAGAGGYTSAGEASLTINSRFGGGGASPYGGGAGAAAGASSTLNGGLYGGGGGAWAFSGEVGPGGPGCLRIIWGEGRAFPNTNTGDL